jgi:hypothetical protein
VFLWLGGCQRTVGQNNCQRTTNQQPTDIQQETTSQTTKRLWPLPTHHRPALVCQKMPIYTQQKWSYLHIYDVYSMIGILWGKKMCLLQLLQSPSHEPGEPGINQNPCRMVDLHIGVPRWIYITGMGLAGMQICWRHQTRMSCSRCIYVLKLYNISMNSQHITTTEPSFIWQIFNHSNHLKPKNNTWCIQIH